MNHSLKIGDKVKFSHNHNGQMEIIRLLPSKGWPKYRVRYENGNETIVLIKND